MLTATAPRRVAVKALAIHAAALRTLAEEDCHLGYTLMRQVARRPGRAAVICARAAGREAAGEKST